MYCQCLLWLFKQIWRCIVYKSKRWKNNWSYFWYFRFLRL